MRTMTDEQIYRRLEEIEREIKTCQGNAIRFFDDPAEVSIQHEIIDDLFQEKAWLMKELDREIHEENAQADHAWDNQNIFEKE